ncbi:translation factor SUA5 [Fontimonas thermophila]|uniref:Threonylcarbamoyl-AMP synthase n=1 Tax=Fontimonas thermophila TaxID=1076937 RepID=A0A1I2GZB2_9GAMM|nr:Sua5/YciO/YrdC/YwlC family protein [Fontimonas thermophila]SFF22752.1 translation factor SUA5 [Fontimonas thermophila]
MVIAPWHLRRALDALSSGGVIACPTEAVWGLSCDPLDPRAVLRLLDLKRRDWRKGLIIVAAAFEDLPGFVERPSNAAMKRALATWPGPATWVFPASPDAPRWLTGEHDSIAVRVTAHPLLRTLCARFGPLVSTSANRSGRPPARSITEVRLQFNGVLDAIVPGALGGLAKPTTIRDVQTGHILRR